MKCLCFQYEKELEKTRNNYAALNAQLLDELPRLYAMSLDVVTDSVARLTHAQTVYYHAALDEMYRLLEVSVLEYLVGVPRIVRSRYSFECEPVFGRAAAGVYSGVSRW